MKLIRSLCFAFLLIQVCWADETSQQVLEKIKATVQQAQEASATYVEQINAKANELWSGPATKTLSAFTSVAEGRLASLNDDLVELTNGKSDEEISQCVDLDATSQKYMTTVFAVNYCINTPVNDFKREIQNIELDIDSKILDATNFETAAENCLVESEGAEALTCVQQVQSQIQEVAEALQQSYDLTTVESDYSTAESNINACTGEDVTAEITSIFDSAYTAVKTCIDNL